MIRNIKSLSHWLLSVIITIVFIFFIGGCSKDYFEPVTLSESDTISFANEIQPILTASCLGSGCHGSNGGVPPFLEEGLAYTNLIGGGYVDTLNPESSILYQRLTASSNFMPPSSKLPPLEIQKILIWIKQGANDN